MRTPACVRTGQTLARATFALAISLSSLFVGCAARKTPALAAAVPMPTDDIETLIERGCFRCLEQALTLARQRGLSSLAFEAATLLALRAGELGMPAEQWLTQALELAAGPTDAPSAQWWPRPNLTTYLEMVTAVPPDPLSGHRDDLLVETQARNRARSMLPMWREFLRTDTAPAVLRHYLELTLECSVDTSRE